MKVALYLGEEGAQGERLRELPDDATTSSPILILQSHKAISGGLIGMGAKESLLHTALKVGRQDNAQPILLLSM